MRCVYCNIYGVYSLKFDADLLTFSIKETLIFEKLLSLMASDGSL